MRRLRHLWNHWDPAPRSPGSVSKPSRQVRSGMGHVEEVRAYVEGRQKRAAVEEEVQECNRSRAESNVPERPGLLSDSDSQPDPLNIAGRSSRRGVTDWSRSRGGFRSNTGGF